MSHTFLKEDASLAIYLIIGTQILANAFHAQTHSNTTIKLEDVFAPLNVLT